MGLASSHAAAQSKEELVKARENREIDEIHTLLSTQLN